MNMKMIWYSFILCLLILFISCENSTDSNIEEFTTSVSIKNTETYQYRTGISGDEEGAAIKLQAKHYFISDIVRNADTKWEAVYVYMPKPFYTGTDYVELELSTGSDGASPPTNIEIIKIRIIVE
jgi:hypothetical protein